MSNPENYLEILATTPLFQNIKPAELRALLTCLPLQLQQCRKNDILLLAGEQPRRIGVVLRGILHIVKDDYLGNRTLLAPLAPGDLFGEALCAAEIIASPVTVLAAGEAVVAWLDYPALLASCEQACNYHQTLTANLLRLLAAKNLLLQARLEILALKSIAQKVLTYLATFKIPRGHTITIPFDRQQLAEYLGVDRSALSHQLMRMKKAGLLNYHKNEFIVLKTD